MLSFAPHSLSRTSSISSMGSDDSVTGGANSKLFRDPRVDNAVKRTRKRFTSVQLMMLEHLYHKASHPTREQREQLSIEADIDIRSVTVWFQNKRQTDRRIHRQLSEPVSQPSHLPITTLPPSSPFSDASGNTIHTIRTRTRTLSGDSTNSATSIALASMPLTASASSSSRKRDRDTQNTSTLSRHVRHKPSRHLSLDDVAARAERAAPLPYTPPQCTASPSSSSPPRPQTPEHALYPASTVAADGDAKERALWENMPSSPIAPDPVPRSERDLVRYGRRRYTLEYACAKEIAGVRKEEKERASSTSRGPGKREGRQANGRARERERETTHKRHEERRRAKERTLPDGPTVCVGPTYAEQMREVHTEEEAEDDLPVAEWDAHGDTDTEGVLSETPVTPSSSFGLGELSVIDDEESKSERGGHDVDMTLRQDRKVAVEVEVARNAPEDEDVMDVAYVLCGLSQRR